MSNLSKLIVDEEAMAEEILVSALEPVLGLTRSGELVFKAGGHLSKRARAVAALLGLAAAKRLGLRADDSLPPREIEALTGVQGSTLRPILRELASRGIVRATNGRYAIPSFAVHDAVAELAR